MTWQFFLIKWIVPSVMISFYFVKYKQPCLEVKVNKSMRVLWQEVRCYSQYVPARENRIKKETVFILVLFKNLLKGENT